MYSFIGVLINDSGTFDIADSMINPIVCEQLHVPRENQTILKARNVLPGIYNAYHTMNDKQEVCDLLIIHHTYSFESLLEYPPLCTGNVCAALAHAVCIVDERYHFDSSYSYYKLEKEAFYDGDEILKRLPSSPYPDSIRENLRDVVSSLRRENKHPTGEDIYNATKGHAVWDAFRSNKIISSHWSIDVYNRLFGSVPAAVFKGGVVSKCDPGFLACYIYRNNRAMAYAIRIPLEQIEPEKEDDGGANIILFPERTDKITEINFSGTKPEQ